MSVICPNRNSEQYKELYDVLGSHEMAHLVWDRNGGYPLEFNPAGETSTLFNELLELTNNNRFETIRLKTQYYLDNNPYGQWWVDFKGEPGVFQLEPLLDRLSSKFGYAWRYAEPGELKENERATIHLRSKNPIIVVRKESISTGDILHEFGHIFINHIKRDNRPLYDKLVAEYRSLSEDIRKELEDYIEEHYSDYTDIAKEDEILTYLLERLADNLVDKDTGLFNVLNEVWEYIKKFLADLFGITDVSKITLKTTLKDLAYMMVDPDIQLGLGDTFTSGEFYESYTGNYDLSGTIPFKKKGIKDLPGMENITPELLKNKILEHSKQFEIETDPKLAKEKGRFKYKKDDVYEYMIGVKRICAKYGYGFIGKDDDNINVRVGKTIHGHIENISNDIVDDISDKYGVQLTAQAKRDIEKIFKDLKGKYTALTEVVIGDVDSGIVGVVDLILIDENSNVMLLDFKTKLRGYYNNKQGERVLKDSKFNFWEKGYKGSPSDKEVAHLQLSMYAYIIQKALGIPISSISVTKLDAVTEGEQNSKKQDIITSVRVFEDDVESGSESFYDKKGDVLLHNATLRIIEGDEAYINNKTLENKFKHEKEEFDEVFVTVTKAESEAGEWLDKLIKELNARVNIARKRFDAGSRSSIEELITNIQESESVTESLEWIIYHAYNDIVELDKDLAKFKKEGKEFTPGILYKWKDAVQAYKTLDELRVALMENKEMLPNKKYVNALNYISDKVAYFENKYKVEGKYLIAKWLTPYYNGIKAKYTETLESDYRKLKHREVKKGRMSLDEFEKTYGSIKTYVQSRIDSRKVEKETYHLLLKELEVASNDISELTRWLDNMLDTSDAVSAALVNAFVTADEKARSEAIDKKYDIIESVEALHKVRPKGNFQSEEDYYSFMLEHDKDGKPTQYLLKPYHSSFWEDIEEIRKREKLSKTKQEISAIVKEFQKENRLFDKEEFESALIDYINELHGKKLLKDKDAELLRDYVESTINPRIEAILDIEDLSEETKNNIEFWYYKNRNLFFIYSDQYNNPEWGKFMKLCGIDTNLSLYKQYSLLQSSDNPYAKFYNFIEEMNKEAGKMIPAGYRLYDRLPGVVKRNSERIKSGQNAISILKSNLDVNLFVRPEDIERGNQEYTNEFGRVRYFIPIRYTAKVEKDYQSYDLPTIYFKFWESANDYRNKREILPELEMARFFINSRKAYKRNVFKRIITTDGNVDDDKTAALKDKTVLADMLNDWFEMAVYGKYTKEEKLLWDISGKKKRRSVDLMKFVDLLNRYTSLNLLGGNVVQGTANIIIGEVMQTIENIAHEYVSPKNYTRATGLYTKYLPAVMGDVSLEAPRSLAGQIYQEFNVLDDDVSDTTFSTNTRAGKFLKNTSIYFVQSCGEHWLQNRFLIAMLLEKKAYDKEGNLLGTMWDQYELREGRLKLKTSVDLKRSEWTEKDQLAFKRKVRGVLSRMHGEYSDLGRVAIQRTALGRMAYMFRKFIVPGFRRRWATRNYNERLGQYTEGNYITTARFFKNYWKDLVSLKFALMSENWAGLSDHEKANVRRTLSEAAFLMATIVIATTLYKMGEGDDEDKWWASFLTYQAYRLKTELLFFTPKIDEAWSILRSPMASMAVLQNIIDFSNQLGQPGEVYERGPFKGQLKLKRIMLDFVPLYKQFYKARDIEEQISWFKN